LARGGSLRLTSHKSRCFRRPIHHILDDDIRDFAFGFEHFENFIAEQLFKLNGIRWWAYQKGVVVVKAAIGAENMKMRMKILKVTKTLNGYGAIFMWLILILIAGIIIYFVVNWSKGTKNPADSTRESPIEILKRRYAGGEISKEEFDRLKKDIEK